MADFPKIFCVKVKPNSRKSEYLGVDREGRHIISIAAVAEDNKANLALIKFFKKSFNIKVRIKSGLTNKEKLIEKT